MTIVVTLKGGKGSGHFGHVGILGKVGGSLPSGGGIRKLRDGIPIIKIDVNKLMELHPSWDMTRTQQYADYINSKRLLEEQSISYESKYTQEYSSKFINTVNSGRMSIKAVHKEVPGVKIAYRRQRDLDDITGGGTGGTLGAYGWRMIFLGPRSTADTYIHEYGHFLDSVLGNARGGKTYSLLDPEHLFAMNEEGWFKKESYAEFYHAWIRNKADPIKTASWLKSSGGWGNLHSTDAIVTAWDKLLREELDMTTK